MTKILMSRLKKTNKLINNQFVGSYCVGNLGIARLNMGHYEEAIGYFEQQLATLAQLSTATAMLDKGRAFGNLGDCYDALGDYDEAIKCHEQCLAIALKTKSLRDQEHAYRGLGQSHRCLGNLQQALVCFEKRLVVAHELGNTAAKAQAYGELGQLHSVLGNFEQAVSCLEHQISIARKLSDRQVEAEAASGLGCVYQQMGEHTKALQYHQLDLRLAEETGSSGGQCRAYGNLGATQESLGRLDEAVHCQEQHLSMAAQINDKVAKTKAFASLGRLHHGLGNPSQAVAYLQQGLQISEALSLREEEARIRHRLGLALWGSGDLDGTQVHMERAAGLLEAVRREARGSADYRLSLFDLQTACYQILQRVLVDLGRSSEALLVAERGRTRAFVDLLLERQGAATSDAETRGSHGRVALFDDSLPTSVEQIMEIVNKQKASVLYYSLAAGYLYCWLIVPTKGVVAFHQAAINPEGGGVNGGRSGESSSDSGSARVASPDDENQVQKGEGNLLDQYIQGIREALGVEWQSTGNGGGGREDNNGDLEDLWSQHLGELGDKLNQEGDRSGFLRMVNRSHAFNSSNYSLSSLFSLGSVSINSGQSQLSSVSRPGSLRHSRRSLWQGPACLRSLYDLLLAPVEDRLTQYGQSPLSASSTSRELVLVLDGDLYLVPFALLKPQSSNDYLCERFSLIVSPSLTSLRTGQKSASRSNKLLQMHQARSLTSPLTAVSLSTYSSAMGGGVESLEQQPATSALVIGNPKMSQSVVEQWGWTDIPYAEQEALVVAEMLQTPSLLAGAAATKDAVLRHLSQVECIHFATHVSWKMSAIVLAPSMVDGLAASDGDGASTTGSTRPSLHQQDNDDIKSVASGVAPSSSATTADLPALSEFLLTAADILNLRLCARLVVVSSVHTRDHHGVAHSDGVVGLTRALLAAGAQSVLVSLWPVPDTAVKIFMRTFYSSLLQVPI
jgi:tetratricopeptide (TPR) repeat protein/CHAT domain-containing protein